MEIFNLKQSVYEKYVADTNEEVDIETLAKRLTLIILTTSFKSVVENYTIYKIGKMRIKFRGKNIKDIYWEDEDLIISTKVRSRLEHYYLMNGLTKDGNKDLSVQTKYKVLKEYCIDLLEVNENVGKNFYNDYYTIVNKSNNQHTHCNTINEIKDIIKAFTILNEGKPLDNSFGRILKNAKRLMDKNTKL